MQQNNNNSHAHCDNTCSCFFDTQINIDVCVCVCGMPLSSVRHVCQFVQLETIEVNDLMKAELMKAEMEIEDVTNAFKN